MAILVTGAAGFVGMHVCEYLLRAGEVVVGVDNLTDYYDVRLKEARLGRIQEYENFSFHKIDISDSETFLTEMNTIPDISKVAHMAAQAGVRYSLENPFSYARSNLDGFLTILEYCRHNKKLEHLVYASSSSVYGGNKVLPYSTDQQVDHPVSLYAATKKSNELMAHSYSHLYRFPTTGLRFFTVYGPWGRPDMAYWSFTEALLAGKTLKIFNNGEMKRDFTYIDDIVSGVVKVLSNPPKDEGESGAPYRIYNIGNHRSEPLMELVHNLEKALNVTANLEFLPMQPGDVKETFADIDPLSRDVGYAPTTKLSDGIPKFVEWYKTYFKDKF
ncbi:NAD-dependent epimerase/dehydratase family protein [Sneathiella sp. P13V-1]|uniref:NAD-dependent epimerase/dehydratase family protein n=1 Tax=Sneathiella sp. P13V-1 TaxID=2697366 RepID=UPI00187BBEAE|nr:NAD-dependent epimerase/dehydratase family protein [Sneathiella sp. P13V-1]MBE7638264.1 NAD-dependent epimerase/dehydratase family protein [Sneathiella sp. P13V-1]